MVRRLQFFTLLPHIDAQHPWFQVTLVNMVNSHMPPAQKVRCRQINDSDVDGVADLLTRGFRIRSLDHWRRTLAKLGSHPTPGKDCKPFDASANELLATHQDYGCICLWCVTSERAHPFVFRPRWVKGVVPCAQLIYCRDI
jgi:hypothetical protein